MPEDQWLPSLGSGFLVMKSSGQEIFLSKLKRSSCHSSIRDGPDSSTSTEKGVFPAPNKRLWFKRESSWQCSSGLSSCCSGWKILIRSTPLVTPACLDFITLRKAVVRELFVKLSQRSHGSWGGIRKVVCFGGMLREFERKFEWEKGESRVSLIDDFRLNQRLWNLFVYLGKRESAARGRRTLPLNRRECSPHISVVWLRMKSSFWPVLPFPSRVPTSSFKQ